MRIVPWLGEVFGKVFVKVFVKGVRKGVRKQIYTYIYIYIHIFHIYMFVSSVVVALDAYVMGCARRYGIKIHMD